MPKLSGMDALRLHRSRDADTPFIFLSGTIGEETAVAALREGAQDYLMKNNLKRLIPAIQRELREAEQRRERRRLEQQVQNLQKFEAIGRLAGGIAHDFNNALGVILGWAELGLEELPESSPSRNKFKTIRDQAERTGKLISQLLAFSRHQVLHRRNINLNDVVAETMKLLRSVIEEQVEFVVKLEADLPLTRADQSQFEQVLLNLCLNARDAMPHGGQITIETHNTEIADEDALKLHANAQAGRYVLLSVSDTGIGMDSATQERIFEPFFTTKELGRGTGLGLASVFGVVQQHEGFLTVESAPGLGSTFSIYLQVGPQVADTDEGPSTRQMRRGAETLLVAEDHDLLRQLAYEAFTSQGYNVIVASDGLEAVRLFEEHSTEIQFAILDFMMPGIDGIEALARMRKIRPYLPAILTTGYAEPSTMLAPEVAKITRFLQKPCRPGVLVRTVRDTLDHDTLP
jgi:signal transduction histidine kinase